MGYGDDEPPDVRADPFPATLRSPGGFQLKILTFVQWDHIKLFWSMEGDPRQEEIEIDSGQTVTDYVFQPARSGARYVFSARGCSDSAYCSPISRPIERIAATNTNRLRAFLTLSGVRASAGLRGLVSGGSGEIHLRTLMGLN
jgi:hypothetical protein